MAGRRRIPAAAVGLVGLALACIVPIALSRGQATPSRPAATAGRTPQVPPRGTVGAGGTRPAGISPAACSSREPFSPPLVAVLPGQGTLALDGSRGLAIIVRSLPDPRTTLDSLSEFDAASGRPLRAVQVSSPAVAPSAPGALGEAYFVALDEARGHIIVAHAPFGVGRAPAGRLDLLDERSLGLLRSVPLGSIPGQPVLDRRSALLFVVNQQSGTLSVLDARNGRPLRTVTLAGGALGPEPAPVLDEADELLFVVKDLSRGSLAVLDARSGAPSREIAVGGYPRAAALDGRNGHLLVANHGDGSGGTVSLIEARTGRVLRTTAVPGSPVGIMIDATTHRAFLSYDDNYRISMLDTATGGLLATTRVRADTDARNKQNLTPEPGTEHAPSMARIDEKRRWAIVDVPPILSDEGTERDSTQIVILDSSTGGIVHTVPTAETGWPNAAAVDDRRGRAFTYFNDGVGVYDISCIAGRYNFANLG